MYDAGNIKSVRRAEKDSAAADKQRGEVTAQIMSTMAGRSWMLDRLEDAHIFSTGVDPSNPQMTYFFAGERNAGLKLLNDIMRFCPDQYIIMMHERNQRDAARSRSEQSAAAARTELAGGEEPGREPEDNADD